MGLISMEVVNEACESIARRVKELRHEGMLRVSEEGEAFIYACGHVITYPAERDSKVREELNATGPAFRVRSTRNFTRVLGL